MKTILHKLEYALVVVLALTVTSTKADTFGSGGNTFNIDFVTVGNPGNANDSGTTGSYFSPYGGVSYTFRMGTYEISRDMITKANNGGTLGLTLQNMTSYGGNVGTHPATGLSWNQAARFVNWLNVSSGWSPAYKFAVQPGGVGYTGNENLALWSPSDGGYDALNLYRNSNAHYFLPSENEWYKAAFYSGSGTTYFDYATGSDTMPTAVMSGTLSGTAVYNQLGAQGPADIFLAGGLSHYGTMGQTGNVWEWTESAADGSNNVSSESRAVRDMYWSQDVILMRSDNRFDAVPTVSPDIAGGFRVASVPEPSCALLILGSGLVFLARRRRAAF